ncbi:hypothetical protein N0V88_007547 [Collariella sp. IMI 366227]|nr:hypothetical protein N0V88_007547 [Collariella sp. IMI 366227]
MDADITALKLQLKALKPPGGVRNLKRFWKIFMYPDDAVIVHFFCGQHYARHNSGEDWYGPAGMMRSLIEQLVMRLVDLDRQGKVSLTLDILDDEEYLAGLDAHDLQALCVMLD